MSTLIHNKTLNNVIKLLSILTMAAAGCIGIVYFSADVRVLLICAFFMLFYVVFPGAFLVLRLGLKSSYASTTAARCFFAGFALNVILYFVTDLIGTDIILYAAGPLLSAAYFVMLFRGGSGNALSSSAGILRNIPASFWVFAACVFLCSIFSTQYIYISPAHIPYSNLKLDFGYHAGIINALSAGFPPQDPWISGLIINYHYFAEMLYSIPVRLFGLPSEELLMTCTPYIITPVFSVSLYSLFREFSRFGERAGLYCLALHFSNAFMLKEFTSSWFLYHLYSNINNAGLGISALLVILPLLKEWDACADSDRRRFNTREMFFLALMVMLTTGIKGPVSIVLVGALIGTLILGAIMRKVDRRSLALTVLSVISFVLIYVYILGAQGAQESNETGGSLLNPWEVTDVFFLKSNIMGSFPGPRSLALLVLFGAFAVFYLTAFFVPFIAGYIRELYLVLTGRRDFVFSRVTVYACCLVGFGGLMLLNFSGHSQVYFGFVTSVLVPLVAFWYLEDLSDSTKPWARIVRGTFAVCLCLFALTSAASMLSSAENGRDFYLSRNENHSKYRNITTEEYEAMLWLRDHTDEDSLIASDRYYSTKEAEYDYAYRGHNTHFAYAIYSRRRQYIEGSGFSLDTSGNEMRRTMVETNKEMYDPDNPLRGELARSLDVDYVVVSKRFDDAGDLSNEDYKLCFSNDAIDIYEIE